jgi:hypothetical protein
MTGTPRDGGRGAYHAHAEEYQHGSGGSAPRSFRDHLRSRLRRAARARRPFWPYLLIFYRLFNDSRRGATNLGKSRYLLRCIGCELTARSRSIS